MRISAVSKRRLPSARLPITPMASASLRLMTSSGERAELYGELLGRRILLLPEDEVDEAGTIPRVMAFLRRHGVRLGGGGR